MGISVVIPLYNKKSFISEAIIAFSSQMSEDDELIVVDDHSTDGGEIIAKAEISHLSNARFLQTSSNSGPSVARNLGAKASNNSHILFFDADDLPARALIPTLKSVIKRYPNECIYSFKIAFEAHGESIGKLFSSTIASPRTILHPPHAFCLAALKGVTLCTASSTCVRKDAFLNYNGFIESLRYCEDPELWSRLSSQYSIAYIDEYLAYYRDIGSSLSHQHRSTLGSANSYIDSLIRLSHLHPQPYKRQAKKIFIKNIILSQASGWNTRKILTQILNYQQITNTAEKIFLIISAIIPPIFFRAVISAHRRLR